MSNKKTQTQKKNKTKNKKKKKNTIIKKILILMLLLIIAGIAWFLYKSHRNGGGVSGMLATVVGHDENTKKNLPELKILLLGVSTDLGDTAPTDTIMIASYNPNTQKANLISIPRDTYIGKNKNKATPSDKINSLYSISVDKTLQAVNDLTGLDIKYYAVIKTEALIELVDAIGGVEFDIPIDMYYTDPTQNLVINLKSGLQTVDGEKAEQLLRFRKNNDGTTYSEEYGDNDTGRMRTQRDFIMTVMKQTLKPENIFKLGEILDIAQKNVETNVDIGYIKDYIPYAVEFSTDNLTTDVIPGENKQLPEQTKQWWFFEADEDGVEEMIQQYFYGVTPSGESSGNTTTGATTTTRNGSQTTSDSKLKIQLLNGSGQESKLKQAKELLEEKGYQVTTSETSEISKTIINNQKEVNEETLNEIKTTIGAGSITSKKNLNSKTDLVIIIGNDFNA